MIRRLLIPLLGSGLLLAATAGSALAKCEGPDPKPAFCSEVIVSMNVAGGGTLLAGTRQSVDVSVSQGEQPLPALGVVLTFTRLADGTAVRAYGAATSVPGLWSADVNLPDSGGWTVKAQVVTNTGANYLIPVETSWGAVIPVGSPPKTPVATPTTPVTPAAPVWPVVLGLGFIAAAVLGGGVAWDRSRRRTAAAGIAATSTVTADRT